MRFREMQRYKMAFSRQNNRESWRYVSALVLCHVLDFFYCKCCSHVPVSFHIISTTISIRILSYIIPEVANWRLTGPCSYFPDRYPFHAVVGVALAIRKVGARARQLALSVLYNCRLSDALKRGCKYIASIYIIWVLNVRVWSVILANFANFSQNQQITSSIRDSKFRKITFDEINLTTL